MTNTPKTLADLIPVTANGGRQDYYLDFENGWGIYIWPDVRVNGEWQYGFVFRKGGENHFGTKIYSYLPLTRPADQIFELMREIQGWR
jgi:hypothetical protein